MPKLSKAKREEQRAAREYSLGRLRELLPPGSTVYGCVRHVSRSGMSRIITIHTVKDGALLNLTGLVADVLGYRIVNRPDWGLVVGGCGMDMGFHVVHNLSYAIHGHDSVGEDAIRADEAGRPFKATPEQYRGGYSLEYAHI